MFANTCEQVRQEALAIFYSENCFLIDKKDVAFPTVTAVEWLQTLHDKAPLIKSLHIKVELSRIACAAVLKDASHSFTHFSKALGSGVEITFGDISATIARYEYPDFFWAFDQALRAGLAVNAAIFAHIWPKNMSFDNEMEALRSRREEYKEVRKWHTDEMTDQEADNEQSRGKTLYRPVRTLEESDASEDKS